MKNTYFTRKGKVIGATPMASEFERAEKLLGYVGAYKTINEAKRASHKLQMALDGALGLGSVAVI